MSQKWGPLHPVLYNVAIDNHGQEIHDEFAEVINGISEELGLPHEEISQGAPAVALGPAALLHPDDERRAEELNRRLFERIAPGEDDV